MLEKKNKMVISMYVRNTSVFEKKRDIDKGIIEIQGEVSYKEEKEYRN